ncbi:Golgi-associated plant pathogenesis-related protein 1 [Exaiptasia diaphana]|nr:Golgi-associated plant pathogenesis-related protein 1 [Exaiptasia diaphana]
MIICKLFKRTALLTIKTWEDVLIGKKRGFAVFTVTLWNLTVRQCVEYAKVVWKSTTKLGVGKATATVDGYTRTVVVAGYTPAGNVRGQFQENVLPLV